MPNKYDVEQDAYCYHDTNVLKNLLNIPNQQELAEAETALSIARYAEYNSQITSLAEITLSHFQELHHQLFQDCYEWAGEIRTVDISKGTTRFCNCNHIISSANSQFKRISKLEEHSKESLIHEVADIYCELNIVHPFREGNGRAQRFLFEEMLFLLGFDIVWPDISKEIWIEANIQGYHGQLSELKKIIKRSIQ